MTKVRTSFDSKLLSEDRVFLDKKTMDALSNGGNMLLRTFNTEIFEPTNDELDNSTDSEIETLLRKTKALRPHKNARFLYFRIIASVASLAIICAALFFALNKQTPSNASFEQNPIAENNVGQNNLLNIHLVI